MTYKTHHSDSQLLTCCHLRASSAPASLSFSLVAITGTQFKSQWHQMVNSEARPWRRPLLEVFFVCVCVCVCVCVYRELAHTFKEKHKRQHTTHTALPVQELENPLHLTE